MMYKLIYRKDGHSKWNILGKCDNMFTVQDIAARLRTIGKGMEFKAVSDSEWFRMQEELAKAELEERFL